MAIALASTATKSTSGSTGGTTHTVVIPTLAAGNMAVVGISCWHGSVAPGITSVVDDKGNTYAARVSTTNGNERCAIYFIANCAGNNGDATVTVTYSGAASSFASTLGGWEFSGADSAPGDQSGTGTCAASATTLTATASSVNTVADGLAVSVIALDSGNTHGSFACTGYTVSYSEGDGTSVNPGAGAYKILSAVETSSAAWSWSTGVSANGAGVVGTFKAAAADTLMAQSCL